MKKVIILFVLTFIFSRYIKAAQYLDINIELAQKGLKLLASENEAIIYCPSWEKTSKRYIRNTNYSYGNSLLGISAIKLFGEGENRIEWCVPVDLGCLHIKRGNKAVAVAELLELKDLYDTTQLFKSSFVWIEPSASYYDNYGQVFEPFKATLAINSKTIDYVTNDVYYNFDSSEIEYTLIPEVIDSGKVYVGEHPNLEYYENEEGDIVALYELSDSLVYEQQLSLTYEEIQSLTTHLQNDLILKIPQGTLLKKNDEYGLHFPYKGLKVEVGYGDWGMLYYYTNEEGVPEKMILQNLQFIYKSCKRTITFSISNILISSVEND